MKLTSIPQLYRNFNRWREILGVLSKYGLADWLSRFRSGFAQGWVRDRDGEVLARCTRETRIRLALTELGPTFVKLGQILSTRPDLVGVKLAEELQLLQTAVRPDPPEVVRATIRRELGQEVEELFAEYEDAPLASASIGQAHRARLKTGEPVVVKVQHAGIEERVRVDLDILAGLAQMAARMPEFQFLRPRATVAEFQRTLRRELDFSREARHLHQFAANFAGHPALRVPRSFPQHCTSRVLTMEYLDGVKLSQVAREGNGRFDLDQIARRGAEVYLEMIFSHGFYHADPHPGNLLVMEGNVIGLLDCGMVGRLDERLRESVEEMMLAMASRDAEQLTSVISRIGETPPELDQAALSADVADFVGHYAARSLEEFQLGPALNEMTEILRRYQVLLPARIAMLLKALVVLEGTSRMISPRFSLLEVMQPFRRKLLWRRLSPAARARRLRRLYSELTYLAQLLPRRIGEILRQMHSGKFDVHLDHRGLEPSVNRLVLGMLASALFLGSSLMLTHKVPPLLHGVSVLGVSGCVVALVLGLRLIRAINKSGHLDGR
jgi:ubiquinone biosynthesis protein